MHAAALHSVCLQPTDLTPAPHPPSNPYYLPTQDACDYCVALGAGWELVPYDNSDGYGESLPYVCTWCSTVDPMHPVCFALYSMDPCRHKWTA